MDDAQGRSPEGGPIGTTVRFYDPKTDTWASTWISPSQRVVQRFVGRQVGSDIVLETTNAEGYPERWMFSDITPDSFRWHSEETHDGGKSWVKTEEMFVQRRK